jgi:hypothetical protein
MPMHIEPFRRRRHVKMSLATQALRRLCKPEKGIESRFSTDGTWISLNRIPEKKKKYDYEDVENQMKSGKVDVSTISNHMQRDAAKTYLRNRGFRCIAKNVYARIECLSS